MSIIFYEYDHCEEIIKNGVDEITQRDLNYLAKYWNYNNYSYIDIKKYLENFCLKNDGNFNVIQSHEMIDRAILHCKSNMLRFPQPIYITKKELLAIKNLNNYEKEKFLFSMLVCAKFFNKHKSKKNPKESKYSTQLYSNNSIRDIQEIAETRFTRKEWKVIKRELTLGGLLSPTIFDKKCWAIGFADNDSEPAIVIDDYRNIIAYYQEFCGEKIIYCKECGVKIVRKSNRHSMCRKCWINRQRELWRKSKQKIRSVQV